MTAYQQNLIQQAHEKLLAAKQHCQDGNDGLSVSESHAAMLLVAEAFLLGERLSVPTEHIPHKFAQHFVQFRRVPPEFHDYLLAARTITEPITHTHALENIAYAEAFLRLADEKLNTLSPGAYCEC